MPTPRNVFVYRGHALDEETRVLLGDGSHWVVINLSSEIFLAERFPSRADLHHPREYVDRPQMFEVQKQARVLARVWPGALPEGVRTFAGLDLTSASEFDAIGQFVEVVKGIFLAESVIRAKPLQIAVVDDGTPIPRAFAAAGERHGVHVRRLPSLAPGRYRESASATLTWPKVLKAKVVQAAIRAASSSRPFAQQRILITDYFRFEPLLDGMSADPEVEFHVMGGGVTRAVGDVTRPRPGIRHPLLTARLGIRQLHELGRYRRAAAAADVEEIIRQGPCFRNYAVLDICRGWLKHQLRRALPGYAVFAEMTRALVAQERITHVVVNQDVAGEQRILCLVANRAGARTVCYQHGLTVDYEFPAHVSDTYAAWGERERAAYERLRRATHSVRILGDPFLARLRSERFDRDEICGRLGLDARRPIVLMTCERYVNVHAAEEWPSTPNARLARACEAFAALPNVQLVVRFKALDAYDEFGDGAGVKRDIINRFNACGNIHVDAGGNLYERLFVSDAVIVTTSTVGLEALLFEKPVFVLTEPDAGEIIEYVSSGVAVRMTTVDEIQEAVASTIVRPAGLSDRARRFVDLNFVNHHDEDPLSRIRQFLAAPSQPRPVASHCRRVHA